MENKLKEPPRIAVKFANMMFLLGILFSILLVVYAIYKIYNLPEILSPVFYIFSILCGGVFAALFGIGLKRLSNNLKVNLLLLFFPVGIAVYGFETYLEFQRSTIKAKREIIAKQTDVSYDTRTQMEVLDDLRDSGVNVIPDVNPASFRKSDGLKTNRGRIYPLGSISNSATIGGNEAGYYPIIETDEYGFNNPKGLYNKNKVDIILTGDSFTEGRSVHSDENISAVLRKLDFNAISIGQAGNGPLIEHAALKEYAEPLKPKIVLWLYFGNDLGDLSEEMKSSILNKYLNEDDYSQNLISRQEEIDGLLKNYIKYEWKKENERRRMEYERYSGIPAIRIIKLYNLRIKINLTPTPTLYLPTLIFRDILQKSKQMVSDWDGKMYLVYLPYFERYSTGNEDSNRNFVMQTATELDIPIIDIHKEVFDPHPDPLSLFPFRLHSHYNAEGYKLVAEAIEKRLQADGYVPIKSKK